MARDATHHHRTYVDPCVLCRYDTNTRQATVARCVFEFLCVVAALCRIPSFNARAFAVRYSGRMVQTYNFYTFPIVLYTAALDRV